MGRCPHEKFTRNNQRPLPSPPVRAPRLATKALTRTWKSLVLQAVWLGLANARHLMHLAILLRPGCKCSSGEIDEVSVNLRLTV